MANWESEFKKLKSWEKTNYYAIGKEWCYKKVPHKIIVEKYLGDNIIDYKFFCFNGNPLYIQVDIDRFD